MSRGCSVFTTTPRAPSLAMDFDDDIDDEALANFDLNAATAKSSLAMRRACGKDADASPVALKRRKVEQLETHTGAHASAGDASALDASLRKYYGLSFRPGQREVITAALAGRDTCVFWSTGSGKSLCYSLAALHSGKISVVVSPLISLMNDQCIGLNNTVGAVCGKDVAVFLGSAQMDAHAERRVFEGEYKIVFVTPEKLTASTSFINGLKRMVEQDDSIGLLAIDEAHCISSWGHDFRQSYTQLNMLREQLPTVPIMALTATAVNFVRNDIMKILGLNNPFVASNSVDRPNLRISVTRKVDFGKDLQQICERIGGRDGAVPTIVYCATIAEVVKLCGALKQRLGDSVVQMYHGSMPNEDRRESHLAFLTSRSPVIVATTAFGMGIDKGDVRRIIHHGAPKTMEEYYQQIGRAGRDGMDSNVTLMFADNDFTRYSSDFYTKDLTPEAARTQQNSTDMLKAFVNDRETCRRVLIMRHFEEKPPFTRCDASCDNCARSALGQDVLRRNFAIEARPIFLTLKFAGGSMTMTKFLRTITNSKESEPLAPWQREAINAALLAAKNHTPGSTSTEFFKEMMAILSQTGLVSERIVKGGYSTYSVYALTSDAQQFCTQSPPALILPTPETVMNAERELKDKLDAIKKKLFDGGVDTSQIPAHELERGSGEIIDAELAWMNKLAYYRSTGNERRADALLALLKKIEAWRDERAVALGMAPAAVLKSFLCKKIAYVLPRSVEALRAVGVRVTGVEELSKVINDAAEEFLPPPASVNASGNELRFGTITPREPWAFAVYKPRKAPKAAGGGMLKPNWELSYDRFTAGEHIEAIALTQPNDKAIQPATVFGHLMEALQHGKTVDLDRAFASLQPEHRLTTEDCQRFAERQASLGFDVRTSPEYAAKDFAQGLVPDIPSADKPPEVRALEAAVYGKIRTWVALRRCGAL